MRNGMGHLLDQGDPERALEHELQARRSLLARYRRVEAATPPPAFKGALRARLLARHDAALAQQRGPDWRTILARLVMPSGSQLAPLGIRGSALRLAKYVAEDLTIALRIEQSGRPGAARVTVFGAIDSPTIDDLAMSGAQVDLLDGDTPVATGSVDDLGTFVLSDVPTGAYRLRLRLPKQVEVIIETLSLDG